MQALLREFQYGREVLQLALIELVPKQKAVTFTGLGSGQCLYTAVDGSFAFCLLGWPFALA
jgi:hypothetical protein